MSCLLQLTSAGVTARKLVCVICLACCVVQVEQILNLRTDLMEAAEKLRCSEGERQTLETDIASLRQQVHTQRQSQHAGTLASARPSSGAQHGAQPQGQQ